ICEGKKMGRIYLSLGLILGLVSTVLGDQIIFDNIGPNGGVFYNGFPSTSQLDNGFGFDAGVADDFILPASSDASGDWNIKSLKWSGIFILGQPASDMHFNIIVWPQ